MAVGEIIKFYRESKGLTQGQLGEGICTVTHVSKIENEKTDYSPEIISLFSKKLNIDIQKEVESFKQIESRLNAFHQAIVMNRKKIIEKLRKELEGIPYIASTKYALHFRLLMTRYWLMIGDIKRANRILLEIEPLYETLTPFEKNLYLHLKGIYYVSHNSNRNDQYKAIQILSKINSKYYPNPEYYHHLALAYHFIDSKVMSYLYAEKALAHFKKTNNYLYAINAESIILLHISENEYCNMEEVEEKYYKLMNDCDMIGADDLKGILFNNLGYAYHRREEYKKANVFFKEALRLAEKESSRYPQRLCNYINNCIEGRVGRKLDLLQKAQYGLKLSKSNNNQLLMYQFQLHIHHLNNEMEEYYRFLEKEVIPYFHSIQHIHLKKDYAKKLLKHYEKTGQIMKKLQLSNFLVEQLLK